MVCASMPNVTPIRFDFQSTVDASLQRLWAFYMSPDALRRLSRRAVREAVTEPRRQATAVEGQVAGGR
jgi:ligand-binding SRPBCC domain-containing protein